MYHVSQHLASVKPALCKAYLPEAASRSCEAAFSLVAAVRGSRRDTRRLLSTSSAAAADSSQATDLLDDLVNYERSGIPAAAGTAASSRFDLGRMHRLLAALGNPHLGLKAVHVAGSKGKGSTVSLLSSILTAAGYRTGAYTSPHLLALEERIAVGQPGGASPRPRPLPPDHLAFLLDRHRDAIRSRTASEGGQLSHFEVVTALALRYFADCCVDIAVLETGLGGLTDATNVMPGANLQAAVITSLGLEHVEALGGSLRSIAAAKAGILRPGRPLVLAPQPHAEAAEVVLAAAEAAGCPVVRAEQAVSVRSRGLQLLPDCPLQAAREQLELQLLPAPAWLREHEQQGEYGTSDSISSNSSPSSSSSSSSTSSSSASSSSSTSSSGAPAGSSGALAVQVGLVGAAQHANVATAVAAVRVLRAGGWRLPDEAVRAGLRGAHLAGRFQVVKLPGPEGPWVVLDGAHTAHSAAALVASLQQAFPQPPPAAPAAPTSTTEHQQQQPAQQQPAPPPQQPIALVLAMAGDKEHREVVGELRALRPRLAVFTAVPIAGSYRRAASPGTLAAHWQAAALLAPPSQRPFRCRELLQGSLPAAFDKALQELRAIITQDGGGSSGGGGGSSSGG
ncbi:hypothetical protein Agub_g1786, partial [Astrephomene gubernaculifera]